MVNHYLKKYNAEAKKNILRVSRSAMEILLQYDWPGNVRELTNVIEHSVIFCKGRGVTPDDLSKDLIKLSKTRPFIFTLSSPSLPETESTLIREVLLETNWNLKLAAEKMNIARGTLYSKMKKYGIKKSQ